MVGYCMAFERLVNTLSDIVNSFIGSEEPCLEVNEKVLNNKIQSRSSITNNIP
jgi:hypothetical protein